MEPILQDIQTYYTDKFEEHGPTARGVDWRDEGSQELRFEQLLRITEGLADFSLLDYGCGYGALLTRHTPPGMTSYTGFDLSEVMVGHAREAHGDGTRVFTSDRADLKPADIVVASGIFNVRLGHTTLEWRDYVLRTMDDINSLARGGFAFNMLTTYSDRDRMRPDLHYMEPAEVFDRCVRNYSRRTALLHDYGLYEFTILVRK